MWTNLNNGIKWWLVFAFPLLAWLLASLGCTQATQEQQMVQVISKEVIIPLAQKAMEQGTTDLHLQAGAQAIEPGYECDLEGLWITGFRGKFTLRLVGASGQIQITSEAAPLPPASEAIPAPKTQQN